MSTLGVDPDIGKDQYTGRPPVPVQTDHDLLVALNEQVYDLRKELRSLHRLMAEIKKTLRQGLSSAQQYGDLQSTHADVTMSDASYHDPLFDLDMDQIGA